MEKFGCSGSQKSRLAPSLVYWEHIVDCLTPSGEVLACIKGLMRSLATLHQAASRSL